MDDSPPPPPPPPTRASEDVPEISLGSDAHAHVGDRALAPVAITDSIGRDVQTTIEKPPPAPSASEPPLQAPPPPSHYPSSSSSISSISSSTSSSSSKKHAPNKGAPGVGASAVIGGGVRLERVIGMTCQLHRQMCVNPVTGQIAYPAGCVVVIYDPMESQLSPAYRHLTLKRTVSALTWSECGAYLAVGERGHQPEVTVWSIPGDLPSTSASTAQATPHRRRRRRAKIVGSLQHHKFGVSAVAFATRGRDGDGRINTSRRSFEDWLLASAGFKHDGQIAIWKWMDSRMVALARVKSKICSIAFCPVTNALVSVGPSHLSFWSHEDNSERTNADLAASGAQLVGEALNANGGFDLNGTIGGSPLRLKPVVAGVPPRFQGSNFVGACYDENGVCYVVTKDGVLCSVESMSRMMTKWLELDTPECFGVSCTVDDSSSARGLLSIACAKGVCRMFRPGTLAYVTTLPRYPNSNQTTTYGDSVDEKNKKEGDYAPDAISVGVCLANQTCAVVYSDRSLVVWDIAGRNASGHPITVDPTKAQKKRVFQYHSDCIWDVHVPGSTPDRMVRDILSRDKTSSAGAENQDDDDCILKLPSDTFLTCGADDTIRVWNLALEQTDLDVFRQSQAMASEHGAAGPIPGAPTWYKPSGPSGSNLVYTLSFRRQKGEGVSGREKKSSEKSPATSPVRAEARLNNSNSGASTTSGSKDGIRCISISPDGRHLASGSRDGRLRVHDLSSLDAVSTCKSHNAEIMSLAFTPCPPALSSESSSSNIAASHVEMLLNSPSGPTLLATSGRDRMVKLYDARRGYTVVSALENHHSASVTAVRFALDGSRLYSCGGDRNIVISRVKESASKSQENSEAGAACGDIIVKRGHSVSAARGTIYDMQIHFNNRWIVTAGHEKRVQIWSAFTGKKMRHWSPKDFPPRAQQVGAVDAQSEVELYKFNLDPTGTFAATAAFDKQVRVYDFLSGECLACVSGHADLVTGVSFSKDARRLISVGADGCIFVWRLPPSMTKAMRSRRAEIRRNCLLQRDRMREELKENIESSGDAQQVEGNSETDSILSGEHASKVSSSSSASLAEEEAEAVPISQKDEEGSKEEIYLENVSNNHSSMPQKNDMTSKVTTEASSEPQIGPSPGVENADLELGRDKDMSRIQAASIEADVNEWLRKSGNSIFAVPPESVLPDPSISSGEEQSPHSKLEKNMGSVNDTSTLDLGKSALPQWAKTSAAMPERTSAASREKPKARIDDKQDNSLAVVGVNRWASRRKELIAQGNSNIIAAGYLRSSSVSAPNSPARKSKIVEDDIASSLRKSLSSREGMPLRNSFSKSLRSKSGSSRHILASSLEDMDSVKMSDDSGPEGSSDENDPIAGVLSEDEEDHDGDTEVEEEIDRVSSDIEVQANDDGLRSKKLSDADKVSPQNVIRRQISQSVDVKMHEGGRIKQESGQSERHALAASDQQVSVPMGNKITRSLAEERQALKLRERQKKTNDAVTEMRRRLAEMGIMQVDNNDGETTQGEQNEKGSRSQDGKLAIPRDKDKRILPTGWSADPNISSGKNPGKSEVGEIEKTEMNVEQRDSYVSQAAKSLKSTASSTEDILELSAPKHSALSPSRARSLEKKKPFGDDLESMASNDGKPMLPPPSYESAVASSNKSGLLKKNIPDREAADSQLPTGGNLKNHGGLIDRNAEVLQSLPHPVSDYRQSLSDLKAAMDRVLGMYEEANLAHARLSQSFASFPSTGAHSTTSNDGAANELRAVSGVLSDLRSGIEHANQRLSKVLPVTGSASLLRAPTDVSVSTPNADEEEMMKKYSELAERLERE